MVFNESPSFISISWGMIIDKEKPDKYEIVGSIVAVMGAVIIFYAPR